MNARTRGTCWTLAAAAAMLVGAAGCRQPRPAATVAPTPRELPAVEREIPRMAASIGVEGRPGTYQTLPVPEFKPVEPTPEERKILGEKPPEPKLDALAFYRPPRGVEHGVAPDEFAMLVGANGHGGASVGVDVGTTPYGVSSDVAGRYADAYLYAWRSAFAGLPRTPSGEVGGGWSMSVGENLPRHTAAHATHYDH